MPHPIDGLLGAIFAFCIAPALVMGIWLVLVYVIGLPLIWLALGAAWIYEKVRDWISRVRRAARPTPPTTLVRPAGTFGALIDASLAESFDRDDDADDDY